MFDNIDHIVYAVHDLEGAKADFTMKTGIKVFEGGQHLDQGTCNALVRIGKRTYLEFIAIDNSIKVPESGVWMGLGLLDDPKITRWALSSTDIINDAKLLNTFNRELGFVKKGSRAKPDGSKLQWTMSNVLANTEVDVVPFLLNWEDSIHPSDELPLACGIIDFKVYATNVVAVELLFERLGMRCSVEQAEKQGISLTLGTPKGHFHLA